MIDINELRLLVQDYKLAGSPVFVQAADMNEILDRLEAAEKENTKLREALAQKVTSETMLRDLSVGNGSINASFEGGAAHLLVDSLANQFVESGAANYLEMQFHSEATGPLLLTLQRVNGATPHKLRTKAEKERDALRTKIKEMENQEPVAWLHETRRNSHVVTNAVKRMWGKTAGGLMAAYSIPLCAHPSTKREGK